ncbi:MAG TPA: hypothetical protein DCS87_16790 [Rheinheimera sp.]|nr:hypothetical protein [Rheinheimera sp.]
MITSKSFRDSKLVSISISYDWESSENYVDIVVDRYGERSAYRIVGLLEYEIFEDFTCAHISQCTLLIAPGRVYLSLDPYTEGVKSDKDCFWFVGASIEAISVGR